ncbi:hypothetical protein ACL9SP_11405 [Priestia flexa]|uniref:hypothetical protein n=1 Tax=Priestia flexa TaxID=86664 RepID=UPI0039B53DC4
MDNWLNLIAKQIPDFNFLDIHSLLNFTYSIDYNETYESASYLTMGLLVNKGKERPKLELVLKFKEITDLTMQRVGGSFNQLLGFSITDISNAGWESDKRYKIDDYENDVLHFYCKEIEFISIKEIA